MNISNLKEQYKMGLITVDRQHNLIFDIFLKLSDKKIKSELTTVLYELKDYIDEHFSYEEKIFERFNYELKIHHIEEHNTFRNYINTMITDHEKGMKLIDHELIIFLENWFTGHILNTDKKYLNFFIKNGIK